MGNINIESLTSALNIGTAAGYSEFATDGTHRLRGTSTVFNDMVGDLFGKRLNSSTGKVDYDYTNNALKFQSGGSIVNVVDRVGANLQIDHNYKVGSVTFYPHIHWFQDIVSGAGAAFILTMEWRLQKNGEAKAATWNTTTLTVGGSDDVFDFSGEVDGTYNQLSKFPDISVNCSISDTLQFRMARTDSVTGDMLVYFMDLHGEVDSHGSDEQYTKLT